MTPRMRFLRFVTREGATALVEFALVVPVLVLLLVGALDIGRAVNAYVVVNGASREGARVASLDPSASSGEVVAAVEARTVPLDTGKLVVTLGYYDSGGTLQQSWPPPATVPPSPVRVRVDVSYPWSAVTWMAGQFFAGGTGSQTFSASSTMEGRR